MRGYMTTFRVLAAHHEFIVDANIISTSRDGFDPNPPDILVDEIWMKLGTRTRRIKWPQMDYHAKNKIMDDICEQLDDNRLCRAQDAEPREWNEEIK